MYKSICGNFLLCLKGKYNGSQIFRNIKSIEYASISFGLPCGSVGKEFTCNGETWVQSLGEKMPWRREWLPTLAFLPGEFHVLYSPWGLKELDTTKRLSLSLLLSATFSWSNWKQDLLELFIWFSRRSS